jgi:hypothetical protein
MLLGCLLGALLLSSRAVTASDEIPGLEVKAAVFTNAIEQKNFVEPGMQSGLRIQHGPIYFWTVLSGTEETLKIVPTRRKAGLDRAPMSGAGLYGNVQPEFWRRVNEEWLPGVLRFKTMAQFGDVFQFLEPANRAALRVDASKSRERPLSLKSPAGVQNRWVYLRRHETVAIRAFFSLTNDSDHMR